MLKILITSGCSFTFEKWMDFSEYSKRIRTRSVESKKYTDTAKKWPFYTAEYFKWKLNNSAMGSIGNGLIAKKLIYHVHKALKNYKPEEIIVGVQWSGSDRHETYMGTDEEMDIKWVSEFSTINIGNTRRDNIAEFPVKLSEDMVEDQRRWLIHHPTNRDPLSKIYYKNFSSEMGGGINTLYNILAVQSFLELRHIKYFMTTHVDFFKYFHFDDDEIRYLWDEIKLENFLPVNGCEEWLREHEPKENEWVLFDGHPTKKGQEEFAKQVIIPYIKERISEKIE
jgi:hypothetical protein